MQEDTLSSDISVIATIFLWWQDAHRAWNISEIPLEWIFVPPTELWTPPLRVWHPMNSDIELAVDNVTAARVFQNGTVKCFA